MPKETYYERIEKEEGCKCKEPNIVNGLCIVCGGEARKEIKQEEIKEEDDNKPNGIKWGKTLYPKVLKEKVALVENFLYENEVMCIQGTPGSGKSILIKDILCDMTSGNALWGAYEVPKPLKVCYIQTEGEEEETYERLDNMKVVKSIDDDNWSFLFKAALKINTPSGIAYLMDELKKPGINYDVIIIDPLYRTIRGTVNNDEAANEWCDNVRLLKEMYNPCAVIAIHHLPKPIYHQGKEVKKESGSVIGSYVWEAFFTSIYNFSWDKSKNLRYLVRGKSRNSKAFNDIALRMIEPRPLYFSAEAKDTSLSYSHITEYIREHDKTTRRNLIDIFCGEEYKFAEVTIDRATKKLKENKKIINVRENGQVYYKWVN